MKKYPNKVRIVRLQLEIRQNELARVSGLSKGTISLIERGLVEAKPKSRERLAEALDCNSDWLFTGYEL